MRVINIILQVLNSNFNFFNNSCNNYIKVVSHIIICEPNYFITETFQVLSPCLVIFHLGFFKM